MDSMMPQDLDISVLKKYVNLIQPYFYGIINQK